MLAEYDGRLVIGAGTVLDIGAVADLAKAGAHLVVSPNFDAGVVRDSISYRLALWSTGDARRLQAGEYRFDHPMTPRDVVGKIARGEVDQIAITFPEGLTIAEMAHVFESSGVGAAADFERAAHDAALVRSFDASATDLEGYLFPDTYKVSRRIDAPRLVSAMVEHAGRVLTPELRQAAADRGWTVRQLVTLASIVEKETARPEERPIVAAVYTNRLRIGMALQCAPTVIYALQRQGGFNGNLRRDDPLMDRHNTYRHPGLPPGPIAAPGKASPTPPHPADGILHFVSRNDGSHVFARSPRNITGTCRNFRSAFPEHDRAGRPLGLVGEAWGPAA
jgi:UPF0755 protein